MIIVFLLVEKELYALLLASFAEYGPAAGVRPVKKREHVAARQIEQVHGRLTHPVVGYAPARATHRERDADAGAHHISCSSLAYSRNTYAYSLTTRGCGAC